MSNIGYWHKALSHTPLVLLRLSLSLSTGGDCDKGIFCAVRLLASNFAAGEADAFSHSRGLDDIYNKMATPTPTLAEKLDKIKSPGLQSQQKVKTFMYSEVIYICIANSFVCARLSLSCRRSNQH